MAVHISKVFDTLRTRLLPLLSKVVKTIAYKIIPKIAMILFFIIPFLFDVLPLKIAYIIWIPSLIVFIIDSVFLYIKGKNKPEEFKPHDIFMRGMSAVALYFFISAFITNYYDVNYSWWWISAITTAIAVPITLCNLWKYAEIKNAYTIEQKKTTRINLIKYILFYWLADAFYISIFSHSLLWQFITGGLCMVIIFTNLSNLVISRKVVSKVAMLHDFVAGIAITIYLIYIIPNPSLQNIVLIIASALFGGLITLVGVAWTIKDGHRREAESKRLEKIPYLEVEFGKWMLKEERGSDLPDLWLTITRSENDSCSSLGTSLEIHNIGLGMATDLKCKWVSGEITDDKLLPVSILKCDASCKLSIITTANLPEKETYCTESSLIFMYKDLLENQYNQELNITFEVHRNYTTIISYKINAPKHINLND